MRGKKSELWLNPLRFLNLQLDWECAGEGGSSKISDVFMTTSHPFSYHTIMLLGDVYCKVENLIQKKILVINLTLALSGYHADTPITIKAEAIP